MPAVSPVFRKCIAAMHDDLYAVSVVWANGAAGRVERASRDHMHVSLSSDTCFESNSATFDKRLSYRRLWHQSRLRLMLITNHANAISDVINLKTESFKRRHWHCIFWFWDSTANFWPLGVTGSGR